MIYVDNLVQRGWRYGRNCHLISDDISEVGLDALHVFAERIGLRRSYFQPASFPHYDLTASKRALAIQHGAIAIPCREAVRIVRQVLRQSGSFAP